VGIQRAPAASPAHNHPIVEGSASASPKPDEPTPKPTSDPKDGDGDDDDDWERKDFERPDWANIMYYVTMAVYVTVALGCSLLIFRLRRRQPIAFRRWWSPVASIVGGSMIVVSIWLSEQTDDRFQMPCVASVPLIHAGLWLYAMPYFLQAMRIFFECSFNRALAKRPPVEGLNYKKRERKLRVIMVTTMIIITLIHLGMFAAEYSLLMSTEKNHYPGGFCRNGTGALFFLITGCLYLGTLSVAALMVLFYNEVYMVCWEIKLCAVAWIPSGVMFFLFTLVPDTDPLDSILPPSTWILISVVITLLISGVLLVLVAMFGQRRYEYLHRDGRLLGSEAFGAGGIPGNARAVEMSLRGGGGGRHGAGHVKLNDNDGTSSALPPYMSSQSQASARASHHHAYDRGEPSGIDERSVHPDMGKIPDSTYREFDNVGMLPPLERIMHDPADRRRLCDLMIYRLEVLPLVFVSDYYVTMHRLSKAARGYPDTLGDGFSTDETETIDQANSRMTKRYTATKNGVGYPMRVFLTNDSPILSMEPSNVPLADWYTEISRGIQQRHVEFFNDVDYEASSSRKRRRILVRCCSWL